jgi:hypothetical protein
VIRSPVSAPPAAQRAGSKHHLAAAAGECPFLFLGAPLAALAAGQQKDVALPWRDLLRVADLTGTQHGKAGLPASDAALYVQWPVA